MSGMEEYAAPGLGRRSTFPKEWGFPPADVAERSGWILENIGRGEELRSRGVHVPWLSASLPPSLSHARVRAARALPELMARRAKLAARRAKLLARRYDPNELGG